MRYHVPLKLILLWIANLAVLTALGILFDIHRTFALRDAGTILLTLGTVLTLLEQWLWDKLKGNE